MLTLLHMNVFLFVRLTIQVIQKHGYAQLIALMTWDILNQVQIHVFNNVLLHYLLMLAKENV